ncbi:Transposon TX1 uncharacterized 82 kDa protein [Labeo rohita]|uniref:Transposon TX1 uncharacterized 82 kDa protein n=1 Tax=Labeo rohita TaxID=84645 RepID=A0ABQ8LJ60_LABRO|nr:Transposon TX1 uncharacterized 82 kDa protein [Labeo rohita]
MTAPATRVLSTLTRRHAVKVALAVSVEEICLAIGEVVGHECILSASRMNSATVIFLSSVEKVNEVVEKGIVIDGEFVSVLPLSMPSKRVTLFNVPPFLKKRVTEKRDDGSYPSTSKGSVDLRSAGVQDESHRDTEVVACNETLGLETVVTDVDSEKGAQKCSEIACVELDMEAETESFKMLQKRKNE